MPLMLEGCCEEAGGAVSLTDEDNRLLQELEECVTIAELRAKIGELIDYKVREVLRQEIERVLLDMTKE